MLRLLNSLCRISEEGRARRQKTNWKPTRLAVQGLDSELLWVGAGLELWGGNNALLPSCTDFSLLLFDDIFH